MEFDFENRFFKDLEKVPKNIKEKTEELIDNIVSECNSISEIPNLEKVKRRKNSYRIRIGNYRIGIKYEEKIVFKQIKHRKDIYKSFPLFLY